MVPMLFLMWREVGRIPPDVLVLPTCLPHQSLSLSLLVCFYLLSCRLEYL